MAFSGTTPDIALARDDTSRFLPSIIGLMIYLTVLTLIGSLMLYHTVALSQTAQIQSFSVQLPSQTELPKETIDKVIELMKTTQGVTDITVVSAPQVKKLVEPWLGKSNFIDSLTLPVIIQGKLADNTSEKLPLLYKNISALVPGVEIDNHKEWLQQYSAFVTTLSWVLLSISCLIIAASATIITFASKTSLKIHRSTVDLLHRLGALDSYIARQFQNHAFMLSFKGSFIGSGFAAGTLLALHLMARNLNSPLFPTFHFSMDYWIILVGLPPLMSLIALIVTRQSILSILRKIA